MKTIRRHPNRKLYDTDLKDYVTLNDVAQFIKDGIKLRIYDAKTRTDVTSGSLLQYIVKNENEFRQFLATENLIELIRAKSHPLQGKTLKSEESIDPGTQRINAIHLSESKQDQALIKAYLESFNTGGNFRVLSFSRVHAMKHFLAHGSVPEVFIVDGYFIHEGIDGIFLIKELRKEYPNAVIVSRVSDRLLEKEAERMGANLFSCKKDKVGVLPTLIYKEVLNAG